MQRLVREQREAHGWSYGEVARRAQDTEGMPRIERASVERLEKAALRSSPRQWTIEGLATGLDVPISVVRDAVTRSLGMYTGSEVTDPAVTELLARVDELPADARALWLRLATVLARELSPTRQFATVTGHRLPTPAETAPATKSDRDLNSDGVQALFDLIRQRPELLERVRAMADQTLDSA